MITLHGDQSTRYSIASLSSHLAERRDAGYLVGGNYQVLVLAPDSELGALPDILLLGSAAGSTIMHAHVEEVYALCVLAVVTPYIGPGPSGLQDDRDSMELGVAGVEDMTRHW
jgi:hypothetical protein